MVEQRFAATEGIRNRHAFDERILSLSSWRGRQCISSWNHRTLPRKQDVFLILKRHTDVSWRVFSYPITGSLKRNWMQSTEYPLHLSIGWKRLWFRIEYHMKKVVVEDRLPYYCKTVKMTGLKGPAWNSVCSWQFEPWLMVLPMMAFFDYRYYQMSRTNVPTREGRIRQNDAETTPKTLSTDSQSMISSTFPGCTKMCTCTLACLGLSIVCMSSGLNAQLQYKGAKGKPTVVLAPISDYYLAC